MKTPPPTFPVEVPASTQAVRPQRVTISKILEIATRMETDLKLAGADGRGLHQLIGSIALPASIRRAARAIASIRNKAAHESSFETKDLPDDFWDLAEEVSQWLTLAKQQQGLKICDLVIGKKKVTPVVMLAKKKTVAKKVSETKVKKTDVMELLSDKPSGNKSRNSDQIRGWMNVIHPPKKKN